jgi:hypothetical protein
LNTTQPLALVNQGDAAGLNNPAVIRWAVDPAWANTFLPKAPPAAAAPPGAVSQPPPPKPMLALTAPVEVTVTLTKLALAIGGQGGPLKPGVFTAEADIAVPTAALAVSGVAAPVKNLHIRAAGGAANKDPGALAFSLKVDDMGGGPGPGNKPAVDFQGFLAGIADAAGNPTFGSAKLTLAGEAASVPTPIIDAAAQQDGLIVQALGPAASLKVNANALSQQGGSLSVDANSARAVAQLKGAVDKGVFRQDGPLLVKLSEVTPELGARFTKGLPAIGALEKKTTDVPATVNGTGLTVPLDGQLTKLNGTLVIDPGEARFATSSGFAKLLKVAQQREQGVIGKKLEPLTVTIANGIATYERYRVPLGSFSIETKGTVDLPNKRLDVVTYVPFGELADEVAGVFNSGVGRGIGGAVPLIEKNTMVPLRTTGTFDNPQTKPDLELFVKEIGRNLLKPGQAGEGLLNDLLKKKVAPQPKPSPPRK